jgi:hypothetical protein
MIFQVFKVREIDLLGKSEKHADANVCRLDGCRKLVGDCIPAPRGTPGKPSKHHP